MCRQSSCGDCFEIKGVGEGREREIQRERGRRGKEQPVSPEEQGERAEMDEACLIRELCTRVVR